MPLRRWPAALFLMKSDTKWLNSSEKVDLVSQWNKVRVVVTHQWERKSTKHQGTKFESSVKNEPHKIMVKPILTSKVNSS